MLSSAERLVRKVGRIDALLFFAACAGVLLLFGRTPFEALSMIVVSVLPASAIVRWRGAAAARFILSGKDNFKKVALEGFAWGPGIPFLFMALLAVLFRGAKSPLWPLVPSIYGILTFLLIGCIGALTGMVLLFINRRIVRAN